MIRKRYLLLVPIAGLLILPTLDLHEGAPARKVTPSPGGLSPGSTGGDPTATGVASAPKSHVLATTSTSSTTVATTTSTTTTPAAPAPAVAEPADWPFGTLADCESGTWTPHTADHPHGVIPGSRNWADRRGGYEGGLHFAPGTWDAYRLPDMPANAADATPADQVAVALRTRDGVPGRPDLTPQGWAAWPACSRRIGAR